MARAKRPPVLSLVQPQPEQRDELRGRMDKLALSIADSLLAADANVAEQIAGLKVLAAYHTSKRGVDAPVGHMFDTYRSAMSAEEE